MPIDRQRLAELRRFEDPQAGISEEFLETRLGPREALALLAAPLGAPQSPGWVICPSIGPEHGNLRRLETTAARALAASGFPVLRIRPDVDPEGGVFAEIDLSARVREVEDAVEALRAARGAEPVGVIGMLFGGTVAALMAERLGLPAMALVEPVTRGSAYVRDAVRRSAVAELMTAAGAMEDDVAQRPLEGLETRGYTTIRGLRLTREELERISAVTLVDALESFSGRTLLVGISPAGAPSPGLRKLHERLEALGCEVTLELVDDPLPAPFGDYFYRNDGMNRVDTRLELDRRLTEALVAWALDVAGVLAPAEVA